MTTFGVGFLTLGDSLATLPATGVTVFLVHELVFPDLDRKPSNSSLDVPLFRALAASSELALAVFCSFPLLVMMLKCCGIFGFASPAFFVNSSLADGRLTSGFGRITVPALAAGGGLASGSTLSLFSSLGSLAFAVDEVGKV